jgi:hypothetical protein
VPASRNEGVRATALKLLERGTHTGALQVLGAETCVFDELNDLPTPASIGGGFRLVSVPGRGTALEVVLRA